MKTRGHSRKTSSELLSWISNGKLCCTPGSMLTDFHPSHSPLWRGITFVALPSPGINKSSKNPVRLFCLESLSSHLLWHANTAQLQRYGHTTVSAQWHSVFLVWSTDRPHGVRHNARTGKNWRSRRPLNTHNRKRYSVLFGLRRFFFVTYWHRCRILPLPYFL